MNERSNQKRNPVAWGDRIWSVVGCGTLGAMLGLVVAILGFRLDIIVWWRESLAVGAVVGGAFGLMFPRVGAILANITLIFSD